VIGFEHGSCTHLVHLRSGATGIAQILSGATTVVQIRAGGTGGWQILLGATTTSQFFCGPHFISQYAASVKAESRITAVAKKSLSMACLSHLTRLNLASKYTP